MPIPTTTKKSQINGQMINLNKLEKEKQTKSETSRGKISAEMNQKIGKLQKISENKSWFFEKTNTVDFTQTDQEKKITSDSVLSLPQAQVQSLVGEPRLRNQQKKKKKKQVTKVQNEKRDITTELKNVNDHKANVMPTN